MSDSTASGPNPTYSKSSNQGFHDMHVSPAPHTTQHWHVEKPAASGRRGMVVAQSKNAADAGVAVLDAGGNAVDAAVATALALAAVEPWNSGLGGIGHALVHRAGQAAPMGRLRPTSPAGSTRRASN